MLSWRLRPCFRQVLAYNSEELREKLLQELNHNKANCEVKSFPGFVCVRISEEERHFWSPRLNISVEENEPGKTLVRGTFGPNANVWALYFYGYLITGSIGLFSGIFGGCQLTLGMHAWGLWVFSGMLAINLAMLLASRIGQRIATPQSKILEKVYESAIGEKVDIH